MAAAANAEPKQVGETAKDLKIMANLVAAMKTAIQENNCDKIMGLLAQIHSRVADPKNTALYPENKIKGLVIAAIYYGKIEIAEALFADLPVEARKKYWQPLPENILELQCAVTNLKRWKKFVDFPCLVIETDPLWIRMILNYNFHQLDVTESLRAVIKKLRQQNDGYDGWEALDLLLQFHTKTPLLKFYVTEIYCGTE